MLRSKWVCRYSPILENRISVRHGNCIFTYPKQVYLLFPHLGDPNEQFGTHDKLPWESKVGQKSSQTKSVSVEKSYEKTCITVAAVFENMLPDDISTPHTET